MHFSLNVGSALTVTAALLSATPAIAQPHHHARHQHSRRDAPAGGKCGLAYNNGGLAQQYVGTKAAGWAYNWGSLPDTQGALPKGIEYVPMLHGPFQDYTQYIDANVPTCIAGGSKYLLGFNEPDWPTDDGKNPYVEPATAAQNFRDLLSFRYGDKIKLGAPAVTSSDMEGKGLKWLKPFLQNCKDCKIDFVPIHWYGQPGQDQMFLDHVDAAHNLVKETLGEDVKIWVTEFQCKGDLAQQAAFLSHVLPELEKRDFVARYSYFHLDEALAGGPNAEPGKSYVA